VKKWIKRACLALFMSNEVSSFPSKIADRERWTGTIFTFLSTFFYAISNIAIRYLTKEEVPHDWILFFKEAIGFLILLPWLFLRFGQGRFQYTSKRLVFYVFIAAVVCQLIGARLHVLGFAVIGLIITVPLIQSSTLLGVAVLGHFMLGDSLSRWRKIAIAILIVAITILSIGKGMTADPSVEHNISAGFFLLVAAGTIVAGLAYAIYVVMLRYIIRQHWEDENSAWLSFKFRRWIGHDFVKQPGKRLYSPFPVTLIMAVVFLTGIAIFGTLLYGNHGIAGFYNVPEIAWKCILISGICNALGFFFQIQGLRMTSAVQASLISVSQMILLSLIGYLFFAEVVNTVVLIGLGLTVYGVFISARPEKR
jgi:drug/metabolite transporter (DMT)-like permease